jgi:hypothetical protein
VSEAMDAVQAKKVARNVAKGLARRWRRRFKSSEIFVDDTRAKLSHPLRVSSLKQSTGKIEGEHENELFS